MTTVSERIENFNNRIAEYEAIRKELTNDIEKNIEGFVKDVLQEYNFPFLYMTGYTPSFNDGDPCTFSLNVNDDAEPIIDHFDADFSNFDIVSEDAEKKVSEFFSNLEEILEAALGSYGWELMAAFDSEGKFHYYFNEEYDCGY